MRTSKLNSSYRVVLYYDIYNETGSFISRKSEADLVEFIKTGLIQDGDVIKVVEGLKKEG